ncbi:MAG: hypothetical protein ACNA8L_04815 [Luteolibacter sp.]|jgi:hypothetical protein
MIASSVWIYLTVISRDFLGNPPASIAWLLKPSDNNWEQTRLDMVASGMPLSEVMAQLGNPDEVSEPHVGANIQHLYYRNPRQSGRVIVVTIGRDGNVMSASAGPKGRTTE